ncbi:hypothetical protein P7C70_g2194, partial [Phenoliferia sp. Uapishka_3]
MVSNAFLRELKKSELQEILSLGSGDYAAYTIEMTEIDLRDHVSWTYTLGPSAKVHHLASQKSEDITRADTFYQGYQSEAAAKLLKRNPLSLARIAWENLASQFSFNSGKHYDHVVTVPTYSVDNCPVALRDACTYLSEVSAKVVENEQDAVFNKVLLSAPGVMRFCRKINKSKAKKAAGKSSSSALAPSTSFLVALQPQPFLTVKEKEAKNKEEKKRKVQNVTLLNLELLHGHITIMEGATVQSYFEHAITKPED